MSNAVDKRAWLVARGLAKEGRGKFSNAAKEALAEAERNGIVFTDSKSIVGVVKTVVDGEVVEERREVNPYAPHPEAIREGTLVFVGENGSKVKASATEACHSCRYSFGWCYCAEPKFMRNGEVLSFDGNV